MPIELNNIKSMPKVDNLSPNLMKINMLIDKVRELEGDYSKNA